MRDSSSSSPCCAVSVIVPVYNGERYLASCLDSLLAQDMPDWEAICINDGSLDSSLDILNRYAARDARIRVVDKTNEGVAVARNCGLEAARGEYVTMLDCDDMLQPSALSTMVAAARCHPEADMVMAGITLVFQDGGEYDMGALNYGNAFKGCCLPEETIVFLYGFAVAKLFKRSIISIGKIVQMPGLHYGEDMEFALHYLSLCRAVYVVPDCVYRYMRYGSSVTDVHTSGRHPLSFYTANAASKLNAVQYAGAYWDHRKMSVYAYGCAFLFFREIFRAAAYNYEHPMRLLGLSMQALGSLPKLMRYLPLERILSAAKLGFSKEPGFLKKVRKSIKYRLLVHGR